MFCFVNLFLYLSMVQARPTSLAVNGSFHISILAFCHAQEKGNVRRKDIEKGHSELSIT